MVIGLDIDDTITQHPEFFSLISHALIDTGHRVVIITYREDRPATEADLKQWNIAYSELVTSTIDTCLEYGMDGWKAEMCRQHDVDIFFDDDPRVLKHVDGSTVCIMPLGEIATVYSEALNR